MKPDKKMRMETEINIKILRMEVDTQMDRPRNRNMTAGGCTFPPRKEHRVPPLADYVCCLEQTLRDVRAGSSSSIRTDCAFSFGAAVARRQRSHLSSQSFFFWLFFGLSPPAPTPLLFCRMVGVLACVQLVFALFPFLRHFLYFPPYFFCFFLFSPVRVRPPHRPCVRSRVFGCLCLCPCEGGDQAGDEDENPDDDAGGNEDADEDEDKDEAESEGRTEADDTDEDVPVFPVFAWFRFIALCLFLFAFVLLSYVLR